MLSFLLVIAALILVISYSSSIPTYTNSIVNPGWEIYNQITAMETRAGTKTGANEFTYPRFISGTLWTVDEDSEYYGVPTVQVKTGDLRHVDFTGTPTDQSTAAKTKTVTRNNHTYILDYHIYMFDASIRTIADKKNLPYSEWDHETSWSLNYQDLLFGSGTSGRVGQQFSGGVYVKFVISPWRGGTLAATPENYVINGAWAGVMNSYMFQKEMGQIANQWGQTGSIISQTADNINWAAQLNPSGEAGMFVKGTLDNGAQVPMFADDGAYGNPSPKANWDTDATPDTRIASNVVLYLPAQLQAGAYLTKDWTSYTVTALTPTDVWVKYTIRVDVLTTHDFVLQTAIEPPELEPPTDFFSYALGFWENPSTQFTVWVLFIALLSLAFFYIYIKHRGRGGEKQ